MSKYEIMYIVRADIEESIAKQTKEKFEKILTNMKAKIISSRELGQKRLAYKIKKVDNGYYFLLNVEANSEATKEFDRKALIDENVIRHLIINLDKE